MTPLAERLYPDFLLAFLEGLLVNFEIAGLALGFGIGAGAILMMARLHGGVLRLMAGGIVGLMRAAPTFVVMFFLLNTLPPGAISGVMAVTVSLVPYAAAYVADSGIDAVHEFRNGSRLACFLILPNIARAFFVLVMSSSAGAAVGVPEGIAVLLRQSETLPTIGGKLMLFAIGVLCFGVPLQIGFAIIRWVQHHLDRDALRSGNVMLPPEAPEPAEPRAVAPP